MSDVLFVKHEGVGVLTLNRPEKLNAFGGHMREELLAALQDAEAASDVRVLLLTGAGRAFCAGGDVANMKRLRDASDTGSFQGLLELGRQVVEQLRAGSKPSIAAVHGVAAGAGLSLALACDLRVCSADARFIASFGRLGLHPDWGMSYTLPRVVGPARALELVLTAEAVDAAEALRIGLVNRVAEEGQLLETAMKLAHTLSRRSPHALALSRSTLSHSLDRSWEEAFRAEVAAQLACFESEDLKEGLDAHFERREPGFKGR